MSVMEWVGVIGGGVGLVSGPTAVALALRARWWAQQAEASRVRAEAAARRAREARDGLAHERS